MVEAEPGLNSRLDKSFLLAFLRARKFDYDKAMAMVSKNIILPSINVYTADAHVTVEVFRVDIQLNR